MDDTVPEHDLLVEVLRRIRSRLPQLDDVTAAGIEAEVRRDLGGERVRIAKRRKHLTPEAREQVFQAAMQQVPEREILEAHRISRRSLYNYVKRGAK